MPASKTPIIPGTRTLLLRAVHAEMREKKLLPEQPNAPPLNNSNAGSATSSGVHSNSSASDVCDVIETKKRPTRNRRKKMAVGARDNEEAAHDDSSTEVESDDSERQFGGDGATSSDDDVGHFERHQYWASRRRDEERSGKFRSAGNKKAEKSRGGTRFLWDEKSLNPVRYNEREVVLTAKEKQQLRDGYRKFAMNGPPQMVGTSFGPRPSAFSQIQKTEPNSATTRVENGNHSDSSELLFPLEMAASGHEEPMNLRKAKKLEKRAKQKTKAEKHGVADAKLTVAEAKLGEFGSKLRARQARIDERHAKMCRRRAALKSAEERLQDLESRLDDEEEMQRDRERRVKNRERRVKQEEAGLQIKEASLRKRELDVTEGIKDIESRRKLVEEKEKMLGAMEEILKKREVQHQQDESKAKVGGSVGRAVGSLGRKFMRPKHTSGVTSVGGANTNNSNNLVDVSSNPIKERSTEVDGTKEGSCRLVRNRSDRMSTGSLLKQSAPVPTPRKSLEKRPRESRARSNSLHNDLDDDVIVQRPKNTMMTNSLPRFKGHKAVMGLWL